MATQVLRVIKTLDLAELAGLLKEYWESQPGGLQLYNNHSISFEFEPIRKWLAGKDVALLNYEIVDAHRLLLRSSALSFLRYNAIGTVSVTDTDSIKKGTFSMELRFKLIDIITIIEPRDNYTSDNKKERPD
ncbi:MAG: hypothetical protein HY506_01855 [Candidatus Yanofskybacteria bacterium]|nr:hypothetical protein [Candidatus Yanofskybacteria bacterium]